MAYSIDAITDGCYPGTTCLINKLGIQDESVLAETEAAVVLGKASRSRVSLTLIITSVFIISYFAIFMIGLVKCALSVFQKRVRHLFPQMRLNPVRAPVLSD